MIKKILRITFLCVFSFLLPIQIKALCDTSELARLKELASNINTSYDYRIENSKAYFDIIFNNVFSDLILVDPNGNQYYYDNYNKGQFIFNNYAQNNKYKFDIYSNSESCYDEYVSTIYVNTPTYNPYYQLSVCDDAKEYELCQRWVSHSLNRLEFIENVNNYKIEKNKTIIDEDNNKISTITYVFNFIRMYALHIIIGISIIIIIIKFIRYKKDSFGF